MTQGRVNQYSLHITVPNHQSHRLVSVRHRHKLDAQRVIQRAGGRAQAVTGGFEPMLVIGDQQDARYGFGHKKQYKN